MCVVSMIMDHYGDEWQRRLREEAERQRRMFEQAATQVYPHDRLVTPQEVDEFHRLLERAREYDKKNHEPDCELESKKQQVRELAEQLGIKIDFL